jgi:sulfite exporter TauE/SafE
LFELALAAAFAGGLGAHCAGMCGGIVGALCGFPGRQDTTSPVRYLLAYNAGRIASYACAHSANSPVCHIVAGVGGLLP